MAGKAWTSDGRRRKAWSRDPGLPALTSHFWERDGPLPCLTSTWRLSTGPAIPDWALPHPLLSCLTPPGKKCCGARYHTRPHLYPEHDPQRSQCLGVPSTPPSQPGSRQVRVAVYIRICVRPAASTLVESRSQPSLWCPVVEAEPACFWLPYMNH